MNLRDDRFFKPVWILCGIVLILLYTVFHDAYLNEYLDNAWTFSWAYSWWNHGEVYDHVFGYTDGDGGTALFSRSYVFVYGALASLFGWSRGVGIAISAVFTVGTAALWYKIVRELGYRRQAAIGFGVILLVLEIFYGNGHKIRVDAMGLFLDSLAFFLFVRRRYLPAGLTLGAAFETHPFAMAAGLWMLSHLWLERRKVRLEIPSYLRHAAWFFLGLGIGFAYWYLLHSAYFGGTHITNRLNGNALWNYYFVRQYSWRHWPELAMVAAALIVFIRRRAWTRHPFVLPFLIASLVSTVVIPRGNFHYTAYVYPSFILLLVILADDFRILPWLLVGILAFQTPQYAWLFYTQRGYNHRSYIAELRKAVPDDVDAIYGHPSSWFAFQERNFMAYGYFGRSGMDPAEWPDSFVVIENREFDRWNGRSDLERLADRYTKELLTEWLAYDGTPVRLWKYEKQDEAIS